MTPSDFAPFERLGNGQAPSALWAINAPGDYANSTLSGSECVVVENGPRVATVLLLSGPESGREWQVLTHHLRPMGADHV